MTSDSLDLGCHVKSFRDMLDILANHLPRNSLATLFSSNSLSVRGWWDNLLVRAAYHRDKEVLSELLRIALFMHSDWYEGNEDYILFLSIFTDDEELLQRLLSKGARPTYFSRGFESTTFGAAASRQNYKWSKLLIDSCGDVNIDITHSSNSNKRATFSTFVVFLLHMKSRFSRLWNSQSYSNTKLDGIEILHYFRVVDQFLSAGANVDLEFPLEEASKSVTKFYEKMDYPAEWKPTLLDVCFYWHRPLFDRMLPYSCNNPGKIRRWAICKAALDGTCALVNYFASRSDCTVMDKNRYLRFVLAEQFAFGVIEPNGISGPRRIANSRVARVLVEYGVPICTNLSRLLEGLVTGAQVSGQDEDTMFILRHLVQKGAVVGAIALHVSIHCESKEIFELLTQNGRTAPDHETLVLVDAVWNSDYEKVSRLLQTGSDVNSTLRNLAGVTVLGSLICNGRPDTKMWKFLIERGARLRLYLSDSTCFELLQAALLPTNDFGRETGMDILNVFLEQRSEVDKLSPKQWFKALVSSLASADLLNVVMSLPKPSLSAAANL